MATKRKSVTSPWFYDVSVSFDGAVYTLARRDRWSPPGATVVETVVTDSMEDAAYVLAYYFADDRSTDTWMQGSMVMAMFSAVGVSGADIISAMDAGWSGMFDSTEGLLRDVDPGAPLTDIYGALLGTRES